MRERKREIQHNLSFTFCAIDILQSFDEKKNEEHTSRHPLFNFI